MQSRRRIEMVRMSFGIMVVLALVAAIGLNTQNVTADLLINEVESDTPFTAGPPVINDDLEFVEIYNTGPGAVDFGATPHVLVFYNGNGDESYFSIDLTGILAAGDYLVVGSSTVVNVDIDFCTPPGGGCSSMLQNGADAVALYTGTTAAFPDLTPVTAVNLVDALVYGTNDGDDPELLGALTPNQPQVNEDGGLAGDTDSNQRCPDGAGGALVTVLYGQGVPTPGVTNGCSTANGACCLPGGACIFTGLADCAAQSGTYQGDGTNCLPTNPCPQPMGACCINDICDNTPPWEEPDCLGAGGIWLGPDSDCAAGCPSYAGLWLNEIRIDQIGDPDAEEFFELSGQAGTQLSGLTYVVIGDGLTALGSGVIEAAIDLTGQVVPADGYYFVAEDVDTFGEVADMIVDLPFENSDNVTHVLVTGFSGAVGDDLDTDDNCSLDVIPWTSVLDGVALIEEANPPALTECHYGADLFLPVVGPDGTSVPGHVHRIPDTSGGWAIGPFDTRYGDDTPGAANTEGMAVGACCNGLICDQLGRAACEAGSGTYWGRGVPCTNPNPCNLPCTTLDEAKALPLFTGIKVCNATISSDVDTVFSSTVKTIRIQDSSGTGNEARGITVFGDNATVDAILAGAPVGSIIDLEGMIDSQTGMLELVDDVSRPLVRVAGPTPGSVPTPVPALCSYFQDLNPRAEELESVLVRLTCVAFTQTGTFAYGNYTITDGVDFCTVRVPDVDSAMGGQPIPEGAVNLVVTASQYDTTDPYDSGYQLMLLAPGDIEATPDCDDPPGACCFAPQACRFVTEVICAKLGGNYQGDDIECTPNPCPFVDLGACVLSDNSCQDAHNEETCCALGGTYLGAGAFCDPLPVICGNLKTVMEARAEVDGTEVVLREVVVGNTADLINSTSVKSFHVQDNSGDGGTPRGMIVFGSNAVIDALLDPDSTPGTGDEILEGDQIAICGATTAYYLAWELEVGPNGLNLMNNCGSVGITPSIVTVPDFLALDGRIISTLVTLECVTFTNPVGNFVGATNYFVNDGINPQDVILRIAANGLELVGTPIPDYPVTITGIVADYAGVYQLQPRYLTDLTPCGSICDSCPGDLDGDGHVGFAEWNAFVTALLSPDPNPCADVNDDGSINGLDVQAFVTKILANAGAGTSCTPPIEVIQCAEAGGPGPACGFDYCVWSPTGSTVPGVTQCRDVVVGQPFEFDHICLPCPSPDPFEACDPSPLRMFRWVDYDGQGLGNDCWFEAEPPVTFPVDCEFCDPSFDPLTVAYYQPGVRIVSWNLLGWGGSSPEDQARAPHFQTVLNEIDADIIVAQEVEGTTGLVNFLSLLNGGGGPGGYSMAIFTDGTGTDNAMFYRAATVGFNSADHIDLPTTPREIDRWMVTLGSADLYIYSMHLKAGTASGDEAARAAAAAVVRADTDTLPLGSHFVLAGDFNVQHSGDDGYAVLTCITGVPPCTSSDPDGQAFDPINMPGTWQNNVAFATIHTQSTHSNNAGAPPGAATGGMDDRFDFVLISATLQDSLGLDYVTGTYDAFGQDGAHFNADINDAPPIPEGSGMADALHGASDHLPVVMEVDFAP